MSAKPKALTLVQTIICLVLMIVILGLSFGTIFSAETIFDEELTETFDRLLTEFGVDTENIDIEYPEKADISFSFIISSIISIPSTVDVAFEVMDEIENSEDDDATMNKVTSAVNEHFKDEDFRNFVALVGVILKGIDTSVLLMVVYIILIVSTLILPIVVFIKCLVALIGFLTAIKKPDVAALRVTRAFKGVLGCALSIFVLRFVTNVKFGGGMSGIIVLCIIGLIINILALRLEKLTPEQKKYRNVLQFVSIAGVMSFVLFLIGLSSGNIYETVWAGLEGNFLSLYEGFSEGGEIEISTVISCVLIILSLVFFFRACKYFKKTLYRLAGMIKPSKKKVRDTYLITAIVALFVSIIPIALMVTDYALDFGDSMGSFVLSTIAIVLMIVTEIVAKILKKKLCSKTTLQDKKFVLTGMEQEPIDDDDDDE